MNITLDSGIELYLTYPTCREYAVKAVYRAVHPSKNSTEYTGNITITNINTNKNTITRQGFIRSNALLMDIARAAYRIVDAETVQFSFLEVPEHQYYKDIAWNIDRGELVVPARFCNNEVILSALLYAIRIAKSQVPHENFNIDALRTMGCNDTFFKLAQKHLRTVVLSYNGNRGLWYYFYIATHLDPKAAKKQLQIYPKYRNAGFGMDNWLTGRALLDSAPQICRTLYSHGLRCWVRVRASTY